MIALAIASKLSKRFGRATLSKQFQRGFGFFLFCFMGSTGAGSSPVCGGSLVIWLVKSIAILSDPMPRITRWDFASRAMILLLFSWIGTTLGVIDMHTAWPMLAAHCQSPHFSLRQVSSLIFPA
jgi:hypothetical protein